jgi:hypothetical protein
MNPIRRNGMSIALFLALLWLPLGAQPGLAQTPAATTGADQLALYEGQEALLLNRGRAIVEFFWTGEDEAFKAALSPELLGAFEGITVNEFVSQLETNRIRMALPEAGAWFDARFDGSGFMAGFFYQGSPSTFTLTAVDPQAGDVPTGRWTGEIAPGSTTSLTFSIEFSGTRDALEATIDIPSQDVEGVALGNVAFFESVPVGEMTQERALPFGPQSNTWSAEYAWGDWRLNLDVNVDTNGLANQFSITAIQPLPEDPASGYVSDVTYRLPADGQMFTFWGGNTEFQNYHASFPPQRHAYDLLAWQDGATYSGDGTSNEDYFIWGRPVLSPASGTVVDVVNDSPDIPPALAGALERDATPVAAATPSAQSHPAGNHIVLQTAENEFVYIAHMQQGSVVVDVGDDLQAGDLVGLVGNSGNTSEPHIHIHVQSTSEFSTPETIGLPLEFSDYLADGTLVDLGAPVQGQFIEQD